ncbi:MAG: GGDEF domain-containing protein [Clostridiales bacterium]|nr:GGDEF domain-containing protein [Clostridiales bacterium]
MLPDLKEAWSRHVRDCNGFFQDGWEYIATSNLHMLLRCSCIVVGVLAVYVTVSFLAGYNTLTKVAYCAGLAAHGAFCVYLHRQASRLTWRTRLIQALCQLFLLSLLGLVAFVAAVGMRHEPGLFFAPFTLVLSMIFILPPRRIIVMVTVMTAAFLLASLRLKRYDVFRLDLAMGLVCWTLCVIVDMEILHMRLRDYRLRTELTRLSSTDGLTGLMNKSTAEAKARAYLSCYGQCECSALFVIDLDQFKQINDQLGHQAGDKALEVVGETLMKLFRAQDIVGRVGGDEFVALMKNICDRRMVARRAAVICNAVRRTKLADQALFLTCSVGVALCPQNGTGYDCLFQEADRQLYQVKRSGKNGYRLPE